MLTEFGRRATWELLASWDWVGDSDLGRNEHGTNEDVTTDVTEPLARPEDDGSLVVRGIRGHFEPQQVSGWRREGKVEGRRGRRREGWSLGTTEIWCGGFILSEEIESSAGSSDGVRSSKVSQNAVLEDRRGFRTRKTEFWRRIGKGFRTKATEFWRRNDGGRRRLGIGLDTGRSLQTYGGKPFVGVVGLRRRGKEDEGGRGNEDDGRRNESKRGQTKITDKVSLDAGLGDREKVKDEDRPWASGWRRARVGVGLASGGRRPHGRRGGILSEETSSSRWTDGRARNTRARRRRTCQRRRYTKTTEVWELVRLRGVWGGPKSQEDGRKEGEDEDGEDGDDGDLGCGGASFDATEARLETGIEVSAMATVGKRHIHRFLSFVALQLRPSASVAVVVFQQ
ncbi:hypothetical protein C8R46DRAFT_1194109 [Mycena filopes]|nr:hypothetical protein C8R46DRAFT_1194109 [Mycena filopes]